MAIRAFKKLLITIVLLICSCSKNFFPETESQAIGSGSLSVPSYFLSQLENKELSANRLISAQGKKTFQFVFFTDAHWGLNGKFSPGIIAHIIKNTSIGNVLFGGDVITTHFSDKYEALILGKEFQSAFSFLGSGFYCVYGNHDNNSDGQRDNESLILSNEEVYSFLQSQMTDVAFSDGHNNFYTDFPENQTRLIGLDTGRYYYNNFRNNLPNTAKFLVEALMTAPSDWNLIILSHIWCSSTLKDGVRICKFVSYIQNLLTILDDYNGRKTGKYTCNMNAIEYDFTSAKAKVRLCLGGHNHMDAVLHSNSGIPIVLTGTDSRKVTEQDTAKTGTISEQCIDIIIMNYTDKIMNSFRIGRGADRVVNLQ